MKNNIQNNFPKKNTLAGHLQICVCFHEKKICLYFFNTACYLNIYTLKNLQRLLFNKQVNKNVIKSFFKWTQKDNIFNNLTTLYKHLE